ncbi:hypothetical protein ACFL2T_05155 [Elusimicrobiota bacterium]
MRGLLFSLLLLAPSLCWGAGAWGPRLPLFKLASVAGPCAETGSLQTGVISQGLGVLVKFDAQGLGEEAGRAAAWVEANGPVSLRQDVEGWKLVSDQGSLPLSDGVGSALTHMQGYFGMTAETLARPVTFEELKAAFLSEEGVDGVRFLFEQMIASRLEFKSEVLVPEIGGEATLGREGLEFHPIADPVRPMFRRLAVAIDDADALTRLYEENPEIMEIIDEHGLLSGFIGRLPRYRESGKLTPERILKLQRLTVTTLLQNSADTYVMEPSSQLDAIITQEWSGRYLGWWHTHPPNYRADGWTESGPPSGPDMDIARTRGQNLTIAFHPEGFTAYDLSALADSPEAGHSDIRAIEYRSEEWRRHFAALHAQIGR